MATSVNSAFDEFLRESVRLDSERNMIAKSSKQWLIGVVKGFPDGGCFPAFHTDLIIEYGSYSRKTKIRPLDDIDLMFILHAQGATYQEYEEDIKVFNTNGHSLFSDFQFDNSLEVNSIKVVNKFKEFLKGVPQYKNADIKRNQEAVVLELQSYEWVYDIVPCFMTSPELDNRSYYLIPDGNGHWKKTDPRIDKVNLVTAQGQQDVSVIDVIRLIKFWNARPSMPSIKSYTLEALALSYFATERKTKWVDCEVQGFLRYIQEAVMYAIADPKGIQGDLNHLVWDDRLKVRSRAIADYQLATQARRFEEAGQMKESVMKWGEFFGIKFPAYTQPVSI